MTAQSGYRTLRSRRTRSAARYAQQYRQGTAARHPPKRSPRMHAPPPRQLLSLVYRGRWGTCPSALSARSNQA
eukprot:6193089-Pleurochrysis_carterae.AAC.4